MNQTKTSFISTISGQHFPRTQQVDVKAIPKSILDLLAIEHPDHDSAGAISLGELNNYREQYIRETLQRQVGELIKLEKTVVDTLGKGNVRTQKHLQNHTEKLTYGQHLADKVATFGGFILPRSNSGTNHHDESKSTRRKRP
jgi:hypothetical protein